MSREAHVRICERLGSMVPVDSTAGICATEPGAQRNNEAYQRESFCEVV
jgi:hypothetical protein